MDNDRILELCRKEVLGKAAELCGTSVDDIEYIDISENVVYSYHHKGIKLVLRLMHRGGRSRDQIQAELDWVQYLYNNGAQVPQPIPSINGNLVETIKTTAKDFHVTSLSWLEGEEIEDDGITEELIEQWGEVIGKLHSLTKDYVPAHGDCKRFEWFEDDDVINRRRYVPPDQKLIHEKFDRLVENLGNLPVNRDSYGLIHSDAHNGNFFVKDGRIALYDFDDCFYTWFNLDLATVWYCALYMPQGEGNRKDFMDHFTRTFMRGYNRENRIDEWWMEQIPLFLQYQEMLLYIYLHRIYDVNNLKEKQKEIFAEYRNRIEKDILYFGKLEEQ